MPANSANQEGCFREIIRTIGLLERVMQPYFAQFGISGAQWAILRTLQRAEKEGKHDLRVTDLGQKLLVRLPSITGVLDRLERAGLARRRADKDDHRAKVVELTREGRQLVERILADHDAQIARVMGGLQPAEQVQLGRLLTQLGDHLEKLANGSAEEDLSETD